MSRRKQLRPFKVQDDDDDDADNNTKQTKNADNGVATTSNGGNTNEAQSNPKSCKFDLSNQPVSTLELTWTLTSRIICHLESF